MLDYKIKKDNKGYPILETSLYGSALMNMPQLNKDLGFSQEERQLFELKGKIPSRIETLEEQTQRAYLQFHSYQKKINKNLYLCQLQNTNLVLFYRLISEHLEEMVPIIYTPIVSHIVQEYNQRYFQPNGLYITYEDRHHIEELLNNRTHPDIKLIVVSDGEGVLGIGDQGVGAIAIPVAKLMIYTAFAGINPMNTLPIMLDVGTNNQTLLNDSYYLGWRHKRISGQRYDDFINAFITAVKKTFPNVFLHWEDFGRHNAYYNLAHYREKISSFNDDIQGTGVVTLAALMSAINTTKSALKDQKIVVFGAGTAGMGVTRNICNALIRQGIPKEEAYSHFWLVDRFGLINDHLPDSHITPAQKPYCRNADELTHWKIKDTKHITLEETVINVQPTVLIGCSAQTNAFNESTIKNMTQQNKHPIIFPLSNPTEKSEATPENLIKWTQGKALIATGSPFNPVKFKGNHYSISQCNNYLAFPGIGLGVIAVEAKQVNDEMLWAASKALSQFITCQNLQQQHQLLPNITEAQSASIAIAEAVAIAAIDYGLSDAKKSDVKKLIAQHQWIPKYIPYQRKY